MVPGQVKKGQVVAVIDGNRPSASRCSEAGVVAELLIEPGTWCRLEPSRRGSRYRSWKESRPMQHRWSSRRACRGIGGRVGA